VIILLYLIDFLSILIAARDVAYNMDWVEIGAGEGIRTLDINLGKASIVGFLMLTSKYFSFLNIDKYKNYLLPESYGNYE